ncbi:MAG: hypothetical protein LBH25_14645 [Fibromonadaceae bacterium]|jgi:hypothetical protein|nr:hypothetical protein [Fibromonadaceae bacterium]
MKINAKSIQFCIDSLMAMVAEKYAKKNKISATEALRAFIATKTYELLINAKSYLYLETAEYILDMWKDERNGDWERWQLI